MFFSGEEDENMKKVNKTPTRSGIRSTSISEVSFFAHSQWIILFNSQLEMMKREQVQNLQKSKFPLKTHS